jgi:peptidoglycan/xylan/chitin deacetylase (PgdA/CDA1 family)
MHDADDKQTTADALPEIIEHYMSEGYVFKNYYEIFK